MTPGAGALCASLIDSLELIEESAKAFTLGHISVTILAILAIHLLLIVCVTRDIGEVRCSTAVPGENLRGGQQTLYPELEVLGTIRRLTLLVFFGTSVRLSGVATLMRVVFSCFGVISATAYPESWAGCRERK